MADAIRPVPLAVSPRLRDTLLAFQRKADTLPTTNSPGRPAAVAASSSATAATLLNGKDAAASLASALRQATEGAREISVLVRRAAGFAAAAVAGTIEERDSLATAYEAVRARIDAVVANAGTGGLNLLDGELPPGGPGPSVEPFQARAEAVGLPPAAVGFANAAAARAAADGAAEALDAVARRFAEAGDEQEAGAAFAALIGVPEARATEGAALSEESANLLALRTRQQLSGSEIPLAAESERAFLDLFG